MRHIHTVTKSTMPRRAQTTTIMDCIEYLLNGGNLFGKGDSFADCLLCTIGKGSCAS